MGVIGGWAILSAVLALPNGAWVIVLCAVTGAITGSYLATVALRWPKGHGASSGRSACDGCGKTLRWFELIPIASFAIAGGQCRRCGERIEPLHLGIELGAAFLGGLAAAVMPTLGGALVLSVLFWQLLLLAALDHRHLWLPDRLTLTLAVSGLALGGFIGEAPLLHRAAAMLCGFVALEAVRRAFHILRGHEGMGAGDPKMFGALAAWTGPFVLPFILLGAAAIGLATATASIARKKPLAAFPFGTYLAAATMGYALAAL